MGAVELDGAFNVREIGGLATKDGGRTRHGLLYRGDSLDTISERDAHLLFDELHIGAVIDVRSRQEIAHAPWKASAVSPHEFAIIGDNGIGTQPFPSITAVGLADIYLSNLQDGISAVLATLDVLAIHLRAGIPCLVHCAAGRDRTGIIFATLLAAVDVTDEDIALDYVSSNRHAHHVTQRLAENPLYANGQAPSGDPVVVSAATIVEFLALMRAGHGTPAQFLIDSGLARSTLAQLKTALVDLSRRLGGPVAPASGRRSRETLLVGRQQGVCQAVGQPLLSLAP